MRGKKAWLNMLALFAFVLVQIPASVFAFVSPPPSPVKCSMPCCAGKVAPIPTSAECPQDGVGDHCSLMAMAHHETAARSIASKGHDGCGCVIKSGSVPEVPAVTLVSSSSPTFGDVEAVALPKSVVVPILGFEEVRPGIVGGDSGPPVAGPYCVWHGRAPPVFIA
jgi:hypothetical protein